MHATMKTLAAFLTACAFAAPALAANPAAAGTKNIVIVPVGSRAVTTFHAPLIAPLRSCDKSTAPVSSRLPGPITLPMRSRAA